MADDLTKSLETLHDLMAKTLIEAVKNGSMDNKGYASLLNVARQFLKDNEMTASYVDPDMEELANTLESIKEMPFEGYH